MWALPGECSPTRRQSLSLAGWVAECVWQRPPQSHWTPTPPASPPSLHHRPPLPPHQDWFTMSTVGAVGSSDARSRACILCAHHPDILYLSFNNCCSQVCICVCVCVSRGEVNICVGVWHHLLCMFYSDRAECAGERYEHWCIYAWVIGLCKKMPPMLSDWGKCFPHSLPYNNVILWATVSCRPPLLVPGSTHALYWAGTRPGLRPNPTVWP